MPELTKELTMQFSGDIAGIVTDSIVKTVSAIFGQDVNITQPKEYMPSRNMVVARVLLMQEQHCADFRFVFDRNLLLMLISGFYPEEVLATALPFEDAACEIANIVCNRVKKYLGQQGFDMTMGLPYVERGNISSLNEHGVVSLNFSLNANRLQFDLDITEKRIAV